LYFNPGFTGCRPNSVEITDVSESYTIKSAIISDQKLDKLGFKFYHLTESGPPIIYGVKPGINHFS